MLQLYPGMEYMNTAERDRDSLFFILFCIELGGEKGLNNNNQTLNTGWKLSKFQRLQQWSYSFWNLFFCSLVELPSMSHYLKNSTDASKVAHLTFCFHPPAKNPWVQNWCCSQSAGCDGFGRQREHLTWCVCVTNLWIDALTIYQRTLWHHKGIIFRIVYLGTQIGASNKGTWTWTDFSHFREAQWQLSDTY